MMTGHLKACGLTKSYWKGRIEVPVLRGVDPGPVAVIDSLKERLEKI